MAEQFAFQEVARDGRAVDRDHGVIFTAAALVVDGPGGELLAGAAFALDQHGIVRDGRMT